MASIQAVPGQIWQDDCYYLDRRTGVCKRKYVITLAVDDSGDVITSALTSKPNGLTETPTCSLGTPREGYFLGIPGGMFHKPTWVEFSNIHTLDIRDLTLHIRQGRTRLTDQALPRQVFCALLRCVLSSEDITSRQSPWIGNTAASLKCD